MFTSGTEILKKAENVSMICNAPYDHRLQLMTKTSTKLRKWCLEIVVDMVGISFGSAQTILKAMNLGFMLTIQKQRTNEVNIV